jgi:hypothetical protein
VRTRSSWRSFAAVAVLLTATVQLIWATSSSAVARGLKVPAGRYRFVVKLMMTGVPQKGGGTAESACSGALISPTYIITAGHCFHDADHRHVSGPVPYPTEATLDTADVDTHAGVSRKVVSVVQSRTADIALAKLGHNVRTPPALLSRQAPTKNEVLTLAGWGATSNVKPTPSAQMYWGQMKVQSWTSDTVGVTGYYPHRNTSACLYDSGAPYFTGPYPHSPPVIDSTESNGPACPHDRIETTARVDDLYRWFRRHVPDLPSEPPASSG